MKTGQATSRSPQLIDELRQGRITPRNRAFKEPLQRACRLLGDADQACDLFRYSLQESADPELTTQRLIQLYEARDGRDASEWTRSLVALERQPNFDFEPFRRLSTITKWTPQAASSHQTWLEETFPDSDQRELAIDYSLRLADFDVSVSQTQKALPVVVTAENPRRTFNQLVRLTRMGLSFDQAVGDLAASTSPEDYARLTRIRRRVPAESQAVQQALKILRESPELESSFHQLVELQGSAYRANEILEALEQVNLDPDPLLDLLSLYPSYQHGSMVEGFLQLADLPQPPQSGWLSRHLGFDLTREKAYASQVRIHDDSQRALGDLGYALENPQDWQNDLARLNHLYHLDFPDALQAAPDALRFSREENEALPGPDERIDLLEKMAYDLNSVTSALEALSALSLGAKEGELQPRLNRFYGQLSAGQRVGDAIAYTRARGLVGQVGWSDDQFERLAEDVSGSLLESLASTVCRLGIDTPAEPLTQVLKACRRQREVESVEHFLKPDTAAKRVEILAGLTVAHGLSQALRDSQRLEGRFDEEERFLEVGRAYADLAKVLKDHSPNQLKDHLDWALAQSEMPRYRSIPAERFLMELGRALLLDPDSDAARERVLTALEPELGLIDDVDFLIVGDFEVDKYDS